MENATNKQFHDNVSVMICELSPRWCLHSDVDYILEQGYINSLSSIDLGASTSYLCTKSKENGMPVWVIVPAFIPAHQTIDEYIAKLDKSIENYKKKEIWDTVAGFMWDEPFSNKGHDNEAFLEMTKTLSEKYGKRIFVNFSLGNFENDAEPDFKWILEKEYSKYVTDVGFGLYGWDMRPESQEKLAPYLEALGKKENVELKTAADLYQHYTNKMLSLLEDSEKVRVWYYPCAYNCKPVGGIAFDEGYCAGHLEGLKELLLKQKNPGGLCVYKFKFVLEDNLHAKNPDKWTCYEQTLKNVCKELSDIKLK